MVKDLNPFEILCDRSSEERVCKSDFLREDSGIP
jgi:hypothetical protein